MNRLTSFTIVLSLVLTASGCFTDFEPYRDAKANGPSDVAQEDGSPDVGVDASPDVDGDTASDTGAGGDTTTMSDTDMSDTETDTSSPDAPDVTVSNLGETCTGDNDCAAGETCVLGFTNGLCSTACDTEDACPTGFICGAPAGVNWCVPACDTTCDRPDLACVAWPGIADEVCVSDADADTILDAADNCLEQANFEQLDGDNDGEGDACDSLPLCATMAVSTLPANPQPTPPRQLRGGAGAYVPPIDSFVYVSSGDPGEAAAVSTFDMTAGQWTDVLPNLPVSGRPTITWDGDAQQLIAFGGLTGEPGRLLFLDFGPDAAFPTTWRLGPAAGVEPELVRLHWAGANRRWMSGFDVPFGGAETPQLQLFLLDVGSGSTRLIGSVPGASLNTVSIGHRGNAYVFDPAQPSAVHQFSDGGSVTQMLDTPLFDSLVDGAQPIKAFVADPTGIWFINLATGDVRRLNLVSFTLGPVTYQVTPTTNPELADLSIGFSPRSLALFVSNAPSGDDSVGLTWEFGCALVTDEQDPDVDDIPALQDNCPTERNPNQLDTDRDGEGDVCDLDDDGDGVEDVSDPFPGDTDNDGENNADDDDDDGDRIADPADPFPLDADNDGIPNSIDQDDDGDGFSDLVETNSGSNPFDKLSTPDGHRVVYIVDDGTNRRLEIAEIPTLANGDAGEVVALSESLTPAWPRLQQDSRLVLFHDITDLNDVSLIRWDIDTTGSARLQATGLVPGAADFNEISGRVIFAHGDASWSVSAVAVTGFGTTSPQLLASSEIPVYDLDGHPTNRDVLFSQGPSCPVCADVHRLSTSNGIVSRVSEYDLGVSELRPRLSPAGDAVLFIASLGQDGQLWRGDGAELMAVTDSDMHVASADFVGTSSRMVYSARPADDAAANFRLYLTDVQEGWTMPLTDGSSSVIEVSFAR